MRSIFWRVFLTLFTFIFCYQSLAFHSPDLFENNLSEYKVLIFLSKNCPCSRSHVRHLNELHESSDKVAFFGVITDMITPENRQDIDNYYSKKSFGFPLIQDEDQVLVKKYDALKTPHVVLLQKQSSGRFKRVYEGGVTNNRQFSRATKKFLQDNLGALLAGADIKHSQGKSLGCYIRRL